jgi:glycosyltransferase involved in cell wall biosynthesis
MQMQDLLRSIPSVFKWYGSYGRDELTSIFASIDLVVMPSLCDEVYGLIAREAICYGLPLIVTDSGSLAELRGRSHVLC